VVESATRVAELEAALERRREAIQEVQQQRSDDQASSAQRIATSLYKPIAAALADSFEANSLVALQDALSAALARARIEPIAEPGTVVPFDPDLHSWVGAGYPGAMVRVLTPGFITRREEADVMVLALARVDDPEVGDRAQRT
jgi:molecular chaperone GrpE (heat shock protein)